MRHLALIITIILLAAPQLYPQTISHRRFTVSSGGGLSSDGAYSNWVVAGQTSYGESQDNMYTCWGGFWGGANDWLMSVDKDYPLPLEFELCQNYPNPFNPNTTIIYSLAEPADVILEIYNILGQKTCRLVNEYQNAGHHRVVWQANDFSSGVYFYKLQAGQYSEARKMILLK